MLNSKFQRLLKQREELERDMQCHYSTYIFPREGATAYPLTYRCALLDFAFIPAARITYPYREVETRRRKSQGFVSLHHHIRDQLNLLFLSPSEQNPHLYTTRRSSLAS
jgi:hypothetical protein